MPAVLAGFYVTFVFAFACPSLLEQQLTQ